MSAATADPVGGQYSRQLSPHPYNHPSPSFPHPQQQQQHQYSHNQNQNLPQTQQDGPNVLSRLHALFRPDTRDVDHSRTRRLSFGERLDRVRSGPADVPDTVMPKIKDREAIKVFVVTWNMGDALVRRPYAVALLSKEDADPTA